MKREGWGSPLVQEKCREEKACDKRHPYRIVIVIIIIIITVIIIIIQLIRYLKLLRSRDYIYIYIYIHTHTHEGESNEKIRYALSRNVLNTKCTQ